MTEAILDKFFPYNIELYNELLFHYLNNPDDIIDNINPVLEFFLKKCKTRSDINKIVCSCENLLDSYQKKLV